MTTTPIVQITRNDVDNILRKLSDHELVEDIINEGLEGLTRGYYNAILYNLRRKMGPVVDTAGVNPKYKYPLSSGIAMVHDPVNMVHGVHALKDFRLNFFEGGTNPRYTRGKKIAGSGRYYGNKIRYKRDKSTIAFRGQIAPNHFFTDALTEMDSQVETLLTQIITRAMRNRGIEVQ